MDSMALMPPPESVPGPSRIPLNEQVVFDFTKRKRWADLLVTELTEAVIFVLSASGQVWFCSPAIEELLGWKDEEVVDGDLTEVMNEEDRLAFQRQFEESIRTRTDLLSYARLLCKTDNDLYPNIPVPVQANAGSTSAEFTQVPTRRPAPKEVLFEIKGYAHYAESSEQDSPTEFSGSVSVGLGHPEEQKTVDVATGEVFKCFFAMARPYPSRNTAMLNTFLELKIENERLQQRRDAILAQLNMPHQPRQTPVHSSPSHFRSSSYSYPYAEPSAQGAYDTRLAYPYDDRNTGNSSSSVKGKASSVPEENDEPTGPRKKVKRSNAPEQHVCVTCGRTDSPEWRKGPQGPKTLCNACGLRWAKTVRRDPTAGPAPDPSTDNQGDGGNALITNMGSDVRGRYSY